MAEEVNYLAKALLYIHLLGLVADISPLPAFHYRLSQHSVAA
jgi:hypothetical protein